MKRLYIDFDGVVMDTIPELNEAIKEQNVDVTNNEELTEFFANYDFTKIVNDENILNDSKYEYLFTVEEVNRRVLNGMPFRDAYREVGIEVNCGKFKHRDTPVYTHKGSMGNLCTEEIKKKMERAYK